MPQGTVFGPSPNQSLDFFLLYYLYLCFINGLYILEIISDKCPVIVIQWNY